MNKMDKGVILSISSNCIFSSMTSYTHKRVFAKITVLAQCFGLLPISNASADDVKQLKLNKKSAIYFYCIFVSILTAINLLFFQTNAFHAGVNFSFFVTLFFFACGLVTAILFINLAKNWPEVMIKWRQLDIHMQKYYGFPKNLSTKTTITSIVIIGLAAAEHALFLSFNIFTQAKQMNVDINDYFKSSFKHIFRFIPYNIIIGLLCEIVNISCTFSWNYMDLFIIVTSMSLSSRMNQIRARIQTVCLGDNNKKYQKQEWRDIRQDYTRLYHLTELVNKHLAWLIVVSFLNNLFVILVQLVHSVEPSKEGTVVERLYFAYSFGFLISRTVTVCVTASNLYWQSIEPIWMINALPTDTFSDELDRLLLQLVTNPCCLTGWGLFTIKHSLILDVIGAIVSYELIFVQFKFINYQDT